MDTGNSQQVQSAAPLTQDPQPPSPQLFQQSGDLQSVNTPQLLDNANARISVPVNPAEPSATVAVPNYNNWFPPLGLLLLGIILPVIFSRTRKSASSTKEMQQKSDPVSSSEDALPFIPAKVSKGAAKKSKKSKKKRSKR